MNLNQLQNHSKFRFVLSGFVAIFAVFLCSVSYAAQDPTPLVERWIRQDSHPLDSLRL